MQISLKHYRLGITAFTEHLYSSKEISWGPPIGFFSIIGLGSCVDRSDYFYFKKAVLCAACAKVKRRKIVTAFREHLIRRCRELRSDNFLHRTNILLSEQHVLSRPGKRLERMRKTGNHATLLNHNNLTLKFRRF